MFLLHKFKSSKVERSKFEKDSRSIGFDLISISTNEDFVEPLLSLFKMREKRN